MGPGEFCGEFALLSNAPADATATALEASELLEIPYNKFNKLSFSQPAVLINVIRALSAKLRDTNLKFSDLIDDMIQRNRLTAIGMTASKIIHDIKTPLTVISLTVSLIAVWPLVPATAGAAAKAGPCVRQIRRIERQTHRSDKAA